MDLPRVPVQTSIFPQLLEQTRLVLFSMLLHSEHNALLRWIHLLLMRVSEELNKYSAFKIVVVSQFKIHMAINKSHFLFVPKCSIRDTEWIDPLLQGKVQCWNGLYKMLLNMPVSLRLCLLHLMFLRVEQRQTPLSFALQVQSGTLIQR